METKVDTTKVRDTHNHLMRMKMMKKMTMKKNLDSVDSLEEMDMVSEKVMVRDIMVEDITDSRKMRKKTSKEDLELDQEEMTMDIMVRSTMENANL